MPQGNTFSFQTLLYNYTSSKGHLLPTGETGNSPSHSKQCLFCGQTDMELPVKQKQTKELMRSFKSCPSHK